MMPALPAKDGLWRHLPGADDGRDVDTGMLHSRRWLPCAKKYGMELTRRARNLERRGQVHLMIAFILTVGHLLDRYPRV